MVDFKFYLNRQGVRGQRGEKGDKGFSPSITVKTDTKTEYVLHVQNETDDTSFDTANLKEGLIPEDLGGTVVRYNRTTGEQYYGDIETATEDQLGLVNLTEDVFNPKTETSVLTAQQAMDNYTPLSKANELKTEIDNLKTKTDETNIDLEELNGRVIMNSNDIKTLNYDLADTKADVAQNTSDIANLKTSDATVKTDIEKLKTDKQDKLVAGENITIEGNVISATGGGGEGDVTATGDNVFTGNNTFRNAINTTNTDVIKFGNKTAWQDSQGAEFNVDKSVIQATTNVEGFTVFSNSGNQYSPTVTDTRINSQGNIILATNQNTAVNIAGYKNPPNKILDGNGNIMLSQGNVTAGENVTITNTSKGIQIDATGGVTNITGTAPITVDSNNNISVAVDNQTIQVVDGKLHANMDELGNEVNDLAGRVTATEADITTIQGDITELTGQVELGAKIDDDNIATTSCFSSDKTTDYVNQQMSALSTTIDAAKQDKLVAGDNISMKNNTDGTVTISSTGGGGSTYELPAATADTLGGIKVGSGLSIADDGTLNNPNSGTLYLDGTVLKDGNETPIQITLGKYDNSYISMSASRSGSTILNSIIANKITPYNGSAVCIGKINRASGRNSSGYSGEISNDINPDYYLAMSDITAGDNITLTKDEANGTIQINASGGSSSTDDMMLGHGTNTFKNVSQTSDNYYAKNLYYNHNNALSTWLNVGSGYLETNTLNCKTSLQVGGTRNSYGSYSGTVNITGVSSNLQGEIVCGNLSTQMFGIRSNSGLGILFNPQSLGGSVPALYSNSGAVAASDLYPLYTTKNVKAGDGVVITVDKSNITLSVDTTKFVSMDTYNELLARVEALEAK